MTQTSPQDEFAVEWFVSREGVERGPLALFVLRQHASDGALRPTDLVWRRGEAPTTAAEVSGLLHAAEEVPPRAEPIPTDGNYLVRHWRGDVSLGLSYWLNTVVLGAVVAAVAHVATEAGAGGVDPWTPLAVVGTVLVALLAIHVWQYVGTWRSAGKHVRRGGNAGWAVAARVMIVIGALSTSARTISETVPVLQELADVAAGDPDQPDPRVTLIPGRREIEIAGPIKYGIARELKLLLEANPAVAQIRLESPGGRMAEANNIARLIADRRLVTIVESHCASACGIAFAAGSERWISASAKVGFHQPRLGTRPIPDARTPGREYFVRNGVPDEFIKAAFSHPHESMWYPSTGDLVKNNIVTRVVGWDQITMPTRFRDRETAANELAGKPTLARLREHVPGLFDEIVRDFVAAAENGSAASRPLDAMAERIGRASRDAMASAPDSEVIAATDVSVQIIRTLRRFGGDDCYRYLRPDPRRPVDVAALAPQLAQLEDRAAADVIVAAARNPQAPGGPALVRQNLQIVFAALRMQHGRQTALLDTPAILLAERDRPRFCDVVADLHSLVLASPAGRAGPTLRAMYSQK